MRAGTFPSLEAAMRDRVRQLKRRAFLVAAAGVAASIAAFWLGYGRGRESKPAVTESDQVLPRRERWLTWAEKLGVGPETELLANLDMFADVIVDVEWTENVRRGIGRLALLAEANPTRLTEHHRALLCNALRLRLGKQEGGDLDARQWLATLSRGRK